MVDFGAIKERQQQAWATGDYHMIGTAVACEAGDLRSTPKVLDVATGSGNTTSVGVNRPASIMYLVYWSAGGCAPTPNV